MGRSGYTCIRFTLCFCNLLAWLAGCGILGVGIWLHVAYGGYATVLPSYAALSADSLCIIAGVVTFAIAFFGCCGSWFQSRILLLLYFAIVGLVFALEVTVGSLAFVYRENLTDELRRELTRGIQVNYGHADEQGFTAAWDHIQTELECCGVSGPKDWYYISAWEKMERLPDSCCKDIAETNRTGCGFNITSASNYDKGCFDKVHVWVIERLHLIGIVVLVFAFIQLFGLVASMLIYCTIRQRKRRKSYE
ncbi:hypothetical protein CHUAL_012781 [Chamberlinius hualienensis]